MCLVVESDAALFGIPLGQVREVLRAARLYPVPGSPPVQSGIVNVRGAIVTVLDLLALLTGRRAESPASIVLLEDGTRVIGLTVDSVHDVRLDARSSEGSAAAVFTDTATDTATDADQQASPAVIVNPPADGLLHLLDENVETLDAVALCVRYMPRVEER